MRVVATLPLILFAACSGAPIEPTGSNPGDAPTWHQDVAPIVIERCTACHVEGGIAPFALDTYESAKAYGPAMVAAMESGSMPPFLAQETDACTPNNPWLFDLRTSDEERATVRAWVDAESPLGDPENAMPVVSPFVGVLPRVDASLGLPEPITVDGTTDIHSCLVLDPGLTEDQYVVGRLITSGNPKVLHHVVSYLAQPPIGTDGEPDRAALEAALFAERGVRPGEAYDCFGGPGLETVATEILDAWAPGGLPNLAPPNSGQPMSKAALVILDIHYHPTGTPEVDADTHLSLMFADERPDDISQTILLGNFDGLTPTDFGTGDLLAQPGESMPEFLIPPGESAHVEEMTWQWALPPGFELAVYGAGTHMHYVGRDNQVHLERAAPTGDEQADECLIQTPAWDFNWQRGYAYDAPREAMPVMRNGDVVRVRCTYDNSMANPFLVDALRARGLDAPVEVRLGEDTLDEMCLGALSIVYPNFD